MSRRALVMFVLAAAAVVGPANAQVISPPPRSSGGLFGGDGPADAGRAQQQLTLTVSLIGGYDDNLSPEGQGPSLDPFAPRRRGTTSTVGANSRYRFTRGFNSIDATARTYVNSFRNIGVRPLFGGDGEVRASIRLFGATTVSGAAQVDYRPSFSFSATGAPLQLPDPADPTAGVAAVSSRNSNSVLTIAQEWNPRHQTTLGGSYVSRHFVTGGFDMRSATADLGHRWSFTRSLAAQFSYRMLFQGVEQAVGTRPLESQTVSAGLEYRKPLSRTRRIVFAAGPAATRIKTISSATLRVFEYVAPSGFANARLDLGQTWSLAFDWSRQTTVLEGLTRQTFLTNSAALSFGGGFGNAVTFTASGSQSRGAPHQGDVGSFIGVNGTAQVQVAVTRCCGIFTSYSYYAHQLLGVSGVPAGFPTTLERNTVRVGMNVWLPLYGAFPRTGPQGMGRN